MHRRVLSFNFWSWVDQRVYEAATTDLFEADRKNDLNLSRRLIDEDICKLGEPILVLKSRRNNLAPVSQLPPK
ncbi:hypothetical protein BDZ97DRAFT_509769 [Flammula alnicola]|nr:hypothetical protein BDZ97DRAFT_509769 [Flammula alnicola]